MSETPEPTRKELKDQLAASDAKNAALEERMARLEAAMAAKPEPPTFSEADLARLRAAREELESLRPGSSRTYVAPSGPAPKLIPYRGLVRATAKCAIEYFREVGDVFEVNLPALWTDDPFEAVRVSTREDGTQHVELRTDVTQIDFRFRRVISAAEDPTPRRASAL